MSKIADDFTPEEAKAYMAEARERMRKKRAELRVRRAAAEERWAKYLEPATMVVRGYGEGAPPHADHPDYKFMVRAICIAPNAEDYGKYGQIQDHAVIYTDGNIVLTLYECCYSTFLLPSGYIQQGHLHKDNDFVLTSASLKRLAPFVAAHNAHNDVQAAHQREKYEAAKASEGTEEAQAEEASPGEG